MKPSVSYPPFLLSQNERKGYLFEQWVVKKFHSAGFFLLEWRSDKKVGDIFPYSSTKPDLVVELTDEKIKTFFAVECKWRMKIGEPWNWATLKNIRQYEEYSFKSLTKVFVAIGIGGSPDNPYNSHLIPLKSITGSEYLCQDFMNKYPWPESPNLYKYLQKN